MTLIAWTWAIVRNWTWARAGWQLGREQHQIAAQNRRITNPTTRWVATVKWNGHAWIVDDLEVWPT